MRIRSDSNPKKIISSAKQNHYVKLISIYLPCLLLLAGIVSLSNNVISLPRFTTEYAMPCKTCHINPSGGGMRNEFGNHTMAFNELCFPQTKKYFEDQYRSPRISEMLLFGFDSRYLVFDDGRVFRMQTDAYLAAEPFKNMLYHIRFWENGINENYGLLKFKDEQFYVKFGRFYPAYGLKNSDHKAYTRERTGHGSNVYLDGISFGAEINDLTIITEFFNPLDQRVFVGHLMYNRYVAPVSIFAGASTRLSQKTVNGTDGIFPQTRALFGGASYNRFTAMGEVDLVGRSNDTLITYGSLTTRIQYGAYLVMEYNFFDGSRNLSNGVDEFYRISLELFPIPFVELRPSFTRYTRGSLVGENDFFVQFHIGY